MPGDGTLARHGLTWADYDRLLEAQDGRCAICLRESGELYIDHAHSCCAAIVYRSRTNLCGLCSRGLVCPRCNMLLGWLESTPHDQLIRAIRYIVGANPGSYQPPIHVVAEWERTLLSANASLIDGTRS